MRIIDQNHFRYGLREDGTAVILRYTGNFSNLTLPWEVRGHTLTEIAAGAFRDNPKTFRISIPAAVTSIGANAFANCGTDRTVDEDLARAYTARCRRDLEEMFGYGYEYYEGRLMAGEDPYKTGWKLKLTVKRGSYAEQYCKANGIDFDYG